MHEQNLTLVEQTDEESGILLDVSEIIGCQEDVFKRLRDLALQQRTIAEGGLNPQLFQDIGLELEQLRQSWEKKYLSVIESIEQGILPWSNNLSDHAILIIDGNPAISLGRYTLYDGEAEVFNLTISSRPNGYYVGSYPEVFDPTFTRHTFTMGNIAGSHLQEIKLTFEIIRNRGGSSEWGLSVTGERTIKPAHPKHREIYSPEAGESFKLVGKIRVPSQDRNEIPFKKAKALR